MITWSDPYRGDVVYKFYKVIYEVFTVFKCCEGKISPVERDLPGEIVDPRRETAKRSLYTSVIAGILRRKQ
jgi:hypothetical protein